MMMKWAIFSGGWTLLMLAIIVGTTFAHPALGQVQDERITWDRQDADITDQIDQYRLYCVVLQDGQTIDDAVIDPEQITGIPIPPDVATYVVSDFFRVTLAYACELRSYDSMRDPEYQLSEPSNRVEKPIRGPGKIGPPTTPLPPPVNLRFESIAVLQGQLQNAETDHCIAVQDASIADGASVVAVTCDAQLPEQQVTMTGIFDRPDVYTITFAHSGLCLSVENGSSDDHANIIQETCDGTARQEYTVVDDGGVMAIYTGTGTNKLVDENRNNDNVIQWRNLGNPNQRWRLLTP